MISFNRRLLQNSGELHNNTVNGAMSIIINRVINEKILQNIRKKPYNFSRVNDICKLVKIIKIYSMFIF